jgi:hypothetical protein
MHEANPRSATQSGPGNPCGGSRRPHRRGHLGDGIAGVVPATLGYAVPGYGDRLRLVVTSLTDRLRRMRTLNVSPEARWHAATPDGLGIAGLVSASPADARRRVNLPAENETARRAREGVRE